MNDKNYWNLNKKYLNDDLVFILENLPEKTNVNFPENLTENQTENSSENSLQNAESSSSLSIEFSKTNHPILKADNIYLHSRHDPVREAERFAGELPLTDIERIYLFLGAGLGYIVQATLKKTKKISGVWLEQDPRIIRYALEHLDFSKFLSDGQLKILIVPIQEGELYKAFQGKSTFPVTFVPHRGSLQWKEKEYTRLKYIGESFFHKKDVNIATLVRFEKIWSKNMIQNLTECLHYTPVSRLFGLADGFPILVVGAGPSLSDSILDIKKYREQFLLISVDTAVTVLNHFGIDPDLVYTVDPQALNRVYLEGYKGNAKIILDPTSTYLTPRMSPAPMEGFFTTSPFPLTQILQNISEEEIGSIPFGGSVSTNAYSLAKLMGGKPIYFVGQDLGFTHGHAHAKGAILEERLNWMESRKFRRELHNFRQLTALPKHFEPGLKNSPDSEKIKVQTNEKLIIFRNWFQENASEVINLTNNGLRISGLKESDFDTEFSGEALNNPNKNNSSYSDIEKPPLLDKQKLSYIQKKIYDSMNASKIWTEPYRLMESIRSLSDELNEYITYLEEGRKISLEIYDEIFGGRENPEYLKVRLKKMDRIDELVSSRKNLGDILSTSMQRVIFSVTEGYDSHLSPEEKENPRLNIAKKSVLLYEGLYEQATLLRKQLNRSLLRIQRNDQGNS